MMSELRDLSFCKKSMPTRAGIRGRAARNIAFGAQEETMNQPTNESINATTNESTKHRFGSMFTKARCARRKQREFKVLRHWHRIPERPESHKKIQIVVISLGRLIPGRRLDHLEVGAFELAQLFVKCGDARIRRDGY